MSNVLHEVINSGQPWAAERAQYALTIAEALQNNQITQDEARALLEDLINTDIVMNNTFWIGVQPSLTKEMMEFSARKIESFLGVVF